MRIEDVFTGIAALVVIGADFGAVGCLVHWALGVFFGGWQPLDNVHFGAILVLSAIGTPVLVFVSAITLDLFRK